MTDLRKPRRKGWRMTRKNFDAGTCVNDDGRPICPPSKVLCRECMDMIGGCLAILDGLRCERAPHVAGLHMARGADGRLSHWPTEAHAELEVMAAVLRDRGMHVAVGADEHGRPCLDAWAPPAQSLDDRVACAVGVEEAWDLVGGRQLPLFMEAE